MAAGAIALERVVTLGRQWLAEDPEQWLQHCARQAEQLLQLRAALQQLYAEPHQGSVAPFRRAPEESSKAPQRPGRKPGHRGDCRRSPPPAATDEHIEVALETCPACGERLAPADQRAVEQNILEIPRFARG